jgi:DNA-binding GntR family transcriptional regulator
MSMCAVRPLTLKTGRFVLADRVHEKLKGMILDQQLSPGTSLNIDKLHRELEVSSSPLREALARLTAERLVRFEPFIGYTVAEMPDRKYYQNMMELRLLLECHAARIGAALGNRASLTAMEHELHCMEKARPAAHQNGFRRYKAYRVFHFHDAAFHQALVASALNEPLVEAYAGMQVHLHLARLYVVSGGFETSSPVKDHAKILDAFRKKNADAAEEAVRNHLSNIQVVKNWCGVYTTTAAL